MTCRARGAPGPRGDKIDGARSECVVCVCVRACVGVHACMYIINTASQPDQPVALLSRLAMLGNEAKHPRIKVIGRKQKSPWGMLESEEADSECGVGRYLRYVPRYLDTWCPEREGGGCYAVHVSESR